MTPEEYKAACARTNATDEYNLPRSYVAHDSEYRSGPYCNKSTSVPWNLMHMAIGMVTESGEVMDALKKAMYYGRELDLVNMKEEIGDILWYVAGALRELDLTFEEVFDANIAKLRARYPEKFTEENANVRNLEVERKILENS